MKKIPVLIAFTVFLFSVSLFAQEKKKKEDRKEKRQERKKEKHEDATNSNNPLGLKNNVTESDKKSKELLAEVSKKYKKYKTIRTTFILQIENTESKLNEKQNGTLHLKEDKYRLEMNNQEIICDNYTIWTYLKDSKEVQVNSYKPDKKTITPSQIFTVYEYNFISAPIEEEIENNSPMQVVDITPVDKSKSYFKIKITINKKDNSIKRFKIFDKNGNRYTYDIQKFEPNIKLDDSLFTFDKNKYPGVEVIDLR